MKKVLWFIALTSLLLTAGACKGRHNAANPATTVTIAPPPPQPAPTGTDAMTQTVDVEDSRSEDDGGTLTAKSTAKIAKTAVAKTAKKKTKK